MSFEQRFGGIARLYGNTALAHFSQAHVCVIGIGGVGSWAAEALARSGIGAITLIDMDDICITNTNRQIHALCNQIGQEKTQAMADRIKLINPDCKVTIVDDFISSNNQAEYLLQDFDYVLDAIDSVKAKVALLAFCKRNKIPVITAGGAGGQTDPSQIMIRDLSKTIQDPLAAKVRGDLRRFHHFSKNPKRKFGIDCVFSTEQPKYPDGDGGICNAKPDLDGTMKMDCASGFGAITHITATFGFFMVSRVLSKLAAQAVESKL
ncbi:tRNA cyclic N6-threonylcarbamoyladenosine(37) synthase TcdA [Oceanisphaera pacifica]|uniref:tRNA cyclic N6-threonylcarbamoyladenosine(37) synthase TcdA n=1 Tax=Oceanisphaera pacifica TaxID=2818389 RepID=A0ABS3NHU4_9GAMM|nr:tRNA cyclic N6-threonylcarbamoyladenosine(37) synthase TcdA [Oceanisphaera pacifica]MBO1520159.1 tRNA cyclic N6-threonylcarbamoyladenosine(37) synthase TcdA [Oceanisphaera pacifica]